MKKHLAAFVFTTVSLFSTLSLSGAPAGVIYGSDIKDEQKMAEARIKDAENDLQLSSNAFGNKTPKFAWIYLADCGVKLDQSKAQIKDEPARIAVAVNVFMNIPLTQSTRKELSDKYYSIKKELDHSYLLMSKLEEDLGKQLGVDIKTVRQYLSTLKILCEKTKDTRACELYDRIHDAVESNDLGAIQAAINEATAVISDIKAKNSDVEVSVPSASAGKNILTAPTPESAPVQTPAPVPAPVQTPAATSAPVTTQAAPVYSDQTVKQIYVSMQEKCKNGEQSACDCLDMLDALDKAIATGDQNAKDWVDKISELDAKCKGGDQKACSERDSLISRLKDYYKGDPQHHGPIPPVPAAEPVVPKGPVTVTVVSANGDKRELTFNNGQSIETTYIGGQGQLLKQERVLKIVDMNRQPPYDVVSQRNWRFTIKGDITKSVPGEGCVYHFTFVDDGGLDAFTVKSWSVRDESGSTVASGDSSLTLDVTFKTPGNYTVEVRGITKDLGSEFTINSVVEVSF